MALELHLIDRKAAIHIGSLDYYLPEIERALNFVQQKTGLHIDVYGRTILYQNHCLALLEALYNQKAAVSKAVIDALSTFDASKKLVLLGD